MKKLSMFQVFAIVLGAIIGWGSFMLPGIKFLAISGVINTFIGLFLGCACVIVIEQSYRYMMQNCTAEGGEFTYIYRNLGEKHGFIVGWFLCLAYLSMIPLNAIAFPLVLNKIFPNILNHGYLYTIVNDQVYILEVLVSFLIIILFTWINLKGIKQSGIIQSFIIVILLTSILSVGYLMVDHLGLTFLEQNYLIDYKFSLDEVIQVMAITPFLYVGFDAIPQLSCNLAFSFKKASLLAIVSLLFGALIYGVLNVICALYYGPQDVLGLDWALGSAVKINIGNFGFTLLILALAAAVSSGINGFMICSTKLLGAMGDTELIPNWFNVRNSHYEFKNAIKFTCFVSILAVLLGRNIVGWIVDMSSLGAAIVYLYVCWVTYKLQKTVLAKMTSLAGVLIAIGFIGLLLLPFSPAVLTTPSYLLLLFWTTMGFGLILWKKRRVFAQKG